MADSFRAGEGHRSRRRAGDGSGAKRHPCRPPKGARQPRQVSRIEGTDTEQQAARRSQRHWREDDADADCHQRHRVTDERSRNGTFSAWVAGLPGVYAAADTVTAAKRGIRRALAAHLAALGTLGRELQLTADVTVLRRDVYATRRPAARRRRHRGVTAAREADPQRLRAEPSTPGNRPTSTAVAEGLLTFRVGSVGFQQRPGGGI
jgi:predicted RNase H-like HicB family nuclease